MPPDETGADATASYATGVRHGMASIEHERETAAIQAAGGLSALGPYWRGWISGRKLARSMAGGNQPRTVPVMGAAGRVLAIVEGEIDRRGKFLSPECAEVADDLDVSRTTVRRVLERACDEGRLTRTPVGRGWIYMRPEGSSSGESPGQGAGERNVSE